MPFGKYKDQSLDYIALVEPTYIIWLKTYTDNQIDEKLYDAVVDKLMTKEK